MTLAITPANSNSHSNNTSSPSKHKQPHQSQSPLGSLNFNLNLDINNTMSPTSRPLYNRRTRFLICLTIFISASLIIIVFLGPLFANSFPSLSDRADFLTHKEATKTIYYGQNQNQNSGENVPKYAAVSETETETKIGTNSNNNQEESQPQGQQQPHYFDHTIANILQYDEISAAEKLECPGNVISFVVNATDVKDECDGLRKAFDLTCGGHGSSGTKKNSNDGNDPRDRDRDRRRLMDDYGEYGDYEKKSVGSSHIHVRIHDMVVNTLTIRPIRNYIDKRRNMLKRPRPETQSEFIASASGKETNTIMNTNTNTGGGNRRRLDGQIVQQEQEQQPEENKKPISPSLPTTNSEVAEHMVNDALSLNTDLKDIAKAIEDMHNHTTTAAAKENNMHSSTDNGGGSKGHSLLHPRHNNNDNNNNVAHHVNTAEEDAAAEELKSTAVAVSAIINNPEAIETQACCKSILKVFHEECDSPEEEEFNDKRLFVIVCVIALCGMVKSLIRHFKLRWMPEAGGCIIVGMIGGMFLRFLPSMDFGFQHDMFLRLMVPPIVFEAALNINKNSFKQMAVPIVIFAIWGTFMSTVLAAAIVYYGSHWFSSCTSIPFIESLAFGALISSIDPIAVLSVLSNMGMSDKDPIYVLIFGESLLNDGVAIVLFQTLIHFMDIHIVIDAEACWLATLHFLVIAFGSLFVGLTCGVAATVYFWLMKGIQTPLVEVLMFLCWAFIPYYICDGVDWSGIVSIVAAGFFMDVYVIGSRVEHDPTDPKVAAMFPDTSNTYAASRKSGGVFSQEGFMSVKAKNHIGFVTEINSTLMETAIFAYLGIFLFNKRYHWSVLIALIGIISCIASRSMMVVFSSTVSNMITKFGKYSHRRIQSACSKPSITNEFNSASREIDPRMQLVLIFAGLRGAMSFALVETVPMFDPETGEGSRYKPELKAMTSACIMFTLFILGGCTYYLLENMGMKPAGKDEEVIEMVSLLDANGTEEDEHNPWADGIYKRPPSSTHSNGSNSFDM